MGLVLTWPMIGLVFGDRMPIGEVEIEEIYDAQKQHSKDCNSALYTKNNPDPLTLSARIYELALFIEAYKNVTKKAIIKET